MQLSLNKEPADYPKLHKAAGRPAQPDRPENRRRRLPGARQRRFWIHPSSGIGKNARNG
jgi:ATP-dependent helicase HrpA